MWLVRWKFGPNSILNKNLVDSGWYFELHYDKAEADQHYISLHLSPRNFAITAEIYELVQIEVQAAQPVPEPWTTERNVVVKHKASKKAASISVDELLEMVPEKTPTQAQRAKRDKKIVSMFRQGYTRSEITSAVDVSYHTVCKVIQRDYNEEA